MAIGARLWGSAHRAATASGRSNPETAAERPLTSVRGCGPNPPPCRPRFIGGGTRHLSESVKGDPGAWRWSDAVTPQRTQNRRARSTPAAAAEAGSSASVTSIHAQTRPSFVIRDRNDRASDVRPLHSGPVSSERAPSGKPPWSSSSTFAMPVGAHGCIACGRRVRAEGMRRARPVSIWRRTAAAEGMAHLFALYSPIEASHARRPAANAVHTFPELTGNKGDIYFVGTREARNQSGLPWLSKCI